MTGMTLQDMLSRPETPYGTWVKISSPEIVELMALGGFDFVVLDLEHSPMSLESAGMLSSIARGRGIVPLVRTPDHGQHWIQRALDGGAMGVVVPHVETVEEARRAIAAARHEPVGTRGVGPTSRAGSWGMNPLGDYLDGAQDQGVFIQLESLSAVSNAEEIATLGPTGFLMGPADLSVSMGTTPSDPAVFDAMKRVLEAAHSYHLPCGAAVGDATQARRFAEAGFDFVLSSNDASILGNGARDLVAAFRS